MPSNIALSRVKVVLVRWYNRLRQAGAILSYKAKRANSYRQADCYCTPAPSQAENNLESFILLAIGNYDMA